MEKREDADRAGCADDNPGRRRRRVVRVLGSAVASLVLAAGFLATSVASVPWNDLPSHQYDVEPLQPSPTPVSIGRVGSTVTTTPEGPQTVAQLMDILERAERAAVTAGHPRTSEIDQAAAELGMLLSVYVAQQRALADPRPGIVAASASDARSVAAGDAAVGVDHASAVSNVLVPDGGGTPADETGTDPRAATDPHEAGHTDAGVDMAHEHVDGAVTFDDVVVAATRLANLLDPAAASYVSSILPAEGLAGAGIEAVRSKLTESLLAVVERYASSTDGFQNGRIPASVLCPLDFAPGHMLRCDAADQLTRLSEAYEAEFGVPIPITDSYRSYDAQVAVRSAKPHLAAVPGTSNHGWGLAVDLSYPISTGRSAEYVWLRVHGPDYGWDNPAWARPNGAKPEPWHFEFFAGGPIPDRAWASSDVSTGGGTTAPQESEEDPTPSTSEPAVRPDEGKPKPSPSPSQKASPSPSQKPSPSPSPSPTEPSPSPSEPAPTPSKPAPEPSKPAPEPSEPAPEPSEPAPEPSEPAPEPSEPAPEPSESSSTESSESTSTESTSTSISTSTPSPSSSESTADQPAATTEDSDDATPASSDDEGGA